jgi:hypothetical protein
VLHPFEGKSESAENLAEALKNRRDEARDAIAVAQRKQKRYYDKRHSAKEFNVGDLIVLKFTRFSSRYKLPASHAYKLTSISISLRIIEKLLLLLYRIALLARSRIHDVVSIIHLKSFKDTTDIYLLLIEVDREEEYIIERIDSERINSVERKEYLMK